MKKKTDRVLLTNQTDAKDNGVYDVEQRETYLMTLPQGYKILARLVRRVPKIKADRDAEWLRKHALCDSHLPCSPEAFDRRIRAIARRLERT